MPSLTRTATPAAPTPFAFQPAAPDMAQLRAAAAASVNYTPAAPTIEESTFMAACDDERKVRNWARDVVRGEGGDVAEVNAAPIRALAEWYNEVHPETTVSIKKFSILEAEAADAPVNTPADIQAYMETDALAQAEIDERGGYEHAELTLDDLRELLAVGALVKYDCEGCFRFTGTVEALDFERDKALVSWQQAGFGTRRTWCGFDRLTLVLCKAPAALESAVR